MRVARKGDLEAVEHPGGGDLEPTVASKRLAQVEDEVRPHLADGRDELARAKHRPVRYPYPGSRCERPHHQIGDARDGVVLDRGIVEFTSLYYERHLAAHGSNVTVRQDQDSGFSHCSAPVRG